MVLQTGPTEITKREEWLWLWLT